MPEPSPFSGALLREAGALAGAGLPWLRRLRAEAMARFEAQALPSRRDEAWRLADVDALLRRPRALAPVDDARAPEPGEGGWRFSWRGGQLVEERRGRLPEGALLTTLRRALREQPTSVARFLARRPEPDEPALCDLGAALFQDGIALVLPAGAVLEEPLVLAVEGPGGGEAAFLRHVVALGPGAAVEICEERTGGGGLQVSLLDAELGEEAELLHSRLQLAGPEAQDLALLRVRQAARSVLRHQGLSRGAAQARAELRVIQEGPEAEAELAGLALGAGRQLHDLFTRVEHRAERGSSRQSFRALLAGQASSATCGRVRVAPGAQGADADQQSRALLLSDEACASHAPQLEIETDDVRCTHGTATGQLDPDALFYLRSRGLSEPAARALLLRAFAAEIAERFPPGPVRERADLELDRWLADAGRSAA